MENSNCNLTAANGNALNVKKSPKKNQIKGSKRKGLLLMKKQRQAKQQAASIPVCLVSGLFLSVLRMANLKNAEGLLMSLNLE